MLVIALLTDPVKRARITEAMRGIAVVQFCDSVDDLRNLLRRPQVGGAIVSAKDRDGSPVAPRIRTIKAELPHVPVLAYFALEDDLSRDVVAMVKAGVDGTLFYGTFDSTHVIRKSFEASRSSCTAATSLQDLMQHLPKRVIPIAEYCLTHSTRTLDVEEVALVHGIHRKTLNNWFVQDCGMAPSTFIRWCRLITAADPLVEKGASIERIALELGFPSAGALRGMLKRYAGVKPSQLRALGGSRFVMGRFVHEIENGRAEQQGLRAADEHSQLIAG